MSLSGKIIKWNDERGFGFIKIPSSKKEVFVHIKAFNQRNRRPAIGLEVNFNILLDTQGREKAENVNYVVHELPFSSALKYLVISLLFLMCVFFLSLMRFIPLFISFFYIMMSLITYLVYMLDKNAAHHNLSRTPENTLHLLAMFGGWPGALYAQQSLRHKSKKISFRHSFFFTVFLNIGFLIYMMTPYGIGLINFVSSFKLP